MFTNAVKAFCVPVETAKMRERMSNVYKLDWTAVFVFASKWVKRFAGVGLNHFAVSVGGVSSFFCARGRVQSQP